MSAQMLSYKWTRRQRRTETREIVTENCCCRVMKRTVQGITRWITSKLGIRNIVCKQRELPLRVGRIKCIARGTEQQKLIRHEAGHVHSPSLWWNLAKKIATIMVFKFVWRHSSLYLSEVSLGHRILSERDPCQWVPKLQRESHIFERWAAIRSSCVRKSSVPAEWWSDKNYKNSLANCSIVETSTRWCCGISVDGDGSCNF